MNITYFVYKHTSPSGKVYIGITSNSLQRRWKGGHGYVTNPHFMRAIKKYGWEAFKHEVLAEGLTEQDAKRMESELIAQYDSTNPTKGYNVDPGGNTRSAKTVEKVRLALTGRPLSAAHRARISEAQRGRVLKEETRRAISESCKRNPKVMEHIRALNRSMAGQPKTEEHRRRISESQPRRRAVVNLDTGETFDCIQDAAASCGGAHPNISKACKGERATAYGYRWAYKEAQHA